VFAALRESIADLPPWLVPFRALAERLIASQADSVAQALNLFQSRSDSIVQFIPQSALPESEAYEAYIAKTGCVPTRDNLHDLFNGIMWLTFPQTKRRMNLLQADEIARAGVSGSRGALRDALTVFDENGAILQAPPCLSSALRDKDWNALFITHRDAWQSARLVLFGHALLEKLMRPRKATTAHVWCVDEISDDALAASLLPERLVEKPFSPLPVLGVPGWCDANEDPQFYRDAAVFRLRSAPVAMEDDSTRRTESDATQSTQESLGREECLAAENAKKSEFDHHEG
jgi:hypothetical protein